MFHQCFSLHMYSIYRSRAGSIYISRDLNVVFTALVDALAPWGANPSADIVLIILWTYDFIVAASILFNSQWSGYTVRHHEYFMSNHMVIDWALKELTVWLSTPVLLRWQIPTALCNGYPINHYTHVEPFALLLPCFVCNVSVCTKLCNRILLSFTSDCPYYTLSKSCSMLYLYLECKCHLHEHKNWISVTFVWRHSKVIRRK